VLFRSPLTPSQFFVAVFSDSKPKININIAKELSSYLKIPEKNVEASTHQEKATGVMKGKWTYGDVILLKINDFKSNYDTLKIIREKLQKENPKISRVLINVSGQGDHGLKLGIRAIMSKDFLTAEILEVPWVTLTTIAEKIIKTCSNIGGVYYDITPKPPATIEFE
jgi:GMP synthase (glutamine-hydrolysing)